MQAYGPVPTTAPELGDAPDPAGPLGPDNPDPGLLPALTVGLNDSVNALVPLRIGWRALSLQSPVATHAPANACTTAEVATGATQTSDRLIAWLSASGAVGALQPLQRPSATLLWRLQAHAMQAAQALCASPHNRADAWCSYTLGDAYADEPLWQRGQRGGQLYWTRTAHEFEQQALPIDASTLEACLQSSFDGNAQDAVGRTQRTANVASMLQGGTASSSDGDDTTQLQALLHSLHQLGLLHTDFALQAPSSHG